MSGDVSDPCCPGGPFAGHRAWCASPEARALVEAGTMGAKERPPTEPTAEPCACPRGLGRQFHRYPCVLAGQVESTAERAGDADDVAAVHFLRNEGDYFACDCGEWSDRTPGGHEAHIATILAAQPAAVPDHDETLRAVEAVRILAGTALTHGRMLGAAEVLAKLPAVEGAHP